MQVVAVNQATRNPEPGASIDQKWVIAVKLPDSGNAAARFLQLQLVSHSFSFLSLSIFSLSLSLFFFAFF